MCFTNGLLDSCLPQICVVIVFAAFYYKCSVCLLYSTYKFYLQKVRYLDMHVRYGGTGISETSSLSKLQSGRKFTEIDNSSIIDATQRHSQEPSLISIET